MQFDRKLTTDELESIIELAKENTSAGIVKFYDIALGDQELTYGSVESIKPTEFAIPKDQWGEIAQAFGSQPTNGINGANAMLTWMNVGPSGR